MKGKSWSIPCGMVFKKFYCINCESKLVKEKTHRVVKKDDSDYYLYHDRGTFPRNDVVVYEYRFKCEKCNQSYSYNQQVKYSYLQKKYQTKLISDEQITKNREYIENKKKKANRISQIIFFVSGFLFFLPLYILLQEDKSEKALFKALIMYFVFVVISLIFMCVNRKRKGSRRYKNEDLLEELHTYSSNNFKLIQNSNFCHCFHCLKKFEAKEVMSYIDDNKTALCPYCDIDAVIPDVIDHQLDGITIREMNEYWF